ncbi:SPOR domain-containing protein [Leadbettera azotonutricia]|uniref:Sporulation domain protein n=1 Tax=Leadbettera azotonutricia (strain ATCC BAA-888 / DSM 13862 / ZAS-9) TaxID=545695 RepID=F5Y8L9_LEAAZ|nr:SPOR domain-containing protein [Leadbettera azotonutricia]AEF82411.1 sporulation domain protein [Leadbettera azotonutricia ZAS-9]
MERKKLLLIAISVGVFFVIAIGAAIIAFGPKTSGPAVAAAPIPAGVQGIYQPPVGSIQPASVDPSGLVRDGIQGIQTPPEGTTAQGSDYYINGTAPKVEITVEPKSAAGVPDTAPSGRAATPVRSSPPKPAAAAPKPAASKPAAPKAAAPAARPVAQTRTYDDYWVQAGSFTAKGHAEGVKETLAAKGITSIIENRDVSGTTYFRVRVGPYTSQSEADYWLSLIKSIDGFESSQVWQSQSKR